MYLRRGFFLPYACHEMTTLRFDLFCRVIDNFGDAGICWRLAQALSSAPYHATVRLWIDDLATLEKITQQHLRTTHTAACRKLSIHQWPSDEAAIKNHHWPNPHPIIIETFGGGIPQGMRQQLTPNHLWIMLDHLSAEDWVESFHGMPGHVGTKEPRKYFFYPGFTKHTGGLLRQPDLLSQIQYWQAQPRPVQWQQLASPLNLYPKKQQQLLKSQVFFIFQYPHAPIHQLLAFLSQQPTQTMLLFAADQQPLYQQAKAFLGASYNQQSSIRLHLLPFITQPLFDRLLWSCDFNFVRGEDSWVRALWAQKPFIWQPYPQSQSTHLYKLRAWLRRLALPHAVRKLFLQWNQSPIHYPLYKSPVTAPLTMDFTALTPSIQQRWQQCLRDEAHRLGTQPSLSAQLVSFCRQQLPTPAPTNGTQSKQ